MLFLFSFNYDCFRCNKTLLHAFANYYQSPGDHHLLYFYWLQCLFVSLFMYKYIIWYISKVSFWNIFRLKHVYRNFVHKNPFTQFYALNMYNQMIFKPIHLKYFLFSLKITSDLIKNVELYNYLYHISYYSLL